MKCERITEQVSVTASYKCFQDMNGEDQIIEANLPADKLDNS